MSATVCVLLAGLILFGAVLFAETRLIRMGSLCLAGFALLLAMGFFWSALGKSRCRDIWAWFALIIGAILLGLPELVRFR